MITRTRKPGMLMGLAATAVATASLVSAVPAGAATKLPAIQVRVGDAAAASSFSIPSSNGQVVLNLENGRLVVRDLVAKTGTDIGADPLNPYLSAGVSGDGNVVLFVDNSLNVYRWTKGGSTAAIGTLPASPSGNMINALQVSLKVNETGTMAVAGTNTSDVMAIDMRTASPSIAVRSDLAAGTGEMLWTASITGTQATRLVANYSTSPVTYTTRTVDLAGTAAPVDQTLPAGTCAPNGNNGIQSAGTKVACLVNGTISIFDAATGAMTKTPTSGTDLRSIRSDGSRAVTTSTTSTGAMTLRVETVGSKKVTTVSNVTEIRRSASSGSALSFVAPNSSGVASLQTVAY